MRRVSKSEQRKIQRDLDEIVGLNLRGLLTDRERRAALSRWEKIHALVLEDATRKKMGLPKRRPAACAVEV